jgi:hypothetical protein
VNSTEREPGESKTLLAGEPMRQPSWLVWSVMNGFRVLMLTVLWAGFGMGLGLFCGILVLMTVGAIHHQMPPMDLAYRRISIPAAIATGSGAFLWNLGRTVQAAARRLKER